MEVVLPGGNLWNVPAAIQAQAPKLVARHVGAIYSVKIKMIFYLFVLGFDLGF